MPIAPEFLHLKGREKMKVCLLWLWRVLKGRGGYVTCRALIGIMHVAVSMGFIVISKYLVDVATGQETGNLKLGMVALVVCVCLQLLFGVWGSRLGVHASVKMGNALRSSIFGGVMRSCWKGRESLHTGDVMNRMEGDVDTVTSLLCHTLPMVVVSCVQFVAAFLFLGILDGRLAIVLAVVMPVAFLLSKSYVKRMRSLTHDLLGAESKLQAFMQEHLQNRLLVLTLEYTDRSLKGLDGILQDLKGLVFRRTDYSLFSKCVVQGGFSLGYVAAFLWGVAGLAEGTVSFGMMTAFLQLVAQVQRPVLDLGRQVPAFVQAIASVERLMELEQLPMEARGTSVPLDGKIGVRMEEVTFAYAEGERKIFSNFSHDFKPGSLTAVVGETGVGKSTLIRLLLALIFPKKGSVRFYTENGEIDASPQSRCNIVYVPQGNSLLSGTIRENLLWGNPQATEEQMRKALYTAVADFVYDFPDGLDTLCGEQGLGLSEGQAQRIAIARGLLRPGGVLLLDEPTSSVDADTEKLLLERLSHEMRDKTLILITHRERIAQLCTSTLHLKRSRSTLI